ncbi:MAG: hypothetical protein HY035_05495 [Nitrospirae bacterium]|nr:hypothetical protein [Nitrospirota bacterium]
MDDIRKKEVPYYERPEFKLVVDKLFEDLWIYYKIDKDILKELFYDRDIEYKLFLQFLSSEIHLGNNSIISGNAGVGKSNFLYKLLTEEYLQKEYKFYPIFIDLHLQTLKFEELLIPFIDNIVNYFNTIIKNPLHGIVNNIANVNTNLTKVKQHLEKINFHELKIKLIIFIDDMDYYEKNWYELLNTLLDFIVTPKASVVIAVRPFLKNQILSSFDTRIKKIFKRAFFIELGTLNIENIITVRLACLMKEDKEKSLFKKLFTPKNPILKLINTYDLSAFEKFDYMLSYRLENFMRQISNGNIREIYDISAEVLPFILKNQGTPDLLRTERDGKKKVIVDHKKIMEIFTGPTSKYKLINLHEYKSAGPTKSEKDNSLLQNILETIDTFAITNDIFYKILNDLGYSKDNIRNGIEQLLNYHLIDEEFGDIGDILNNSLIKKYYLTEKGRLYLYHISLWDEYIKKFGKSNLSVFSKFINIKNDPIIFDIIEFLQHLLYVMPTEYHNKFSIRTSRFYTFFIDKYGLKYNKCAETDNCYIMDSDKLTNYITRYALVHNKDSIVSSWKVNRKNYSRFAFLGSKIEELIKELKLDNVNLEHIVDKEFFLKIFNEEIKGEDKDIR